MDIVVLDRNKDPRRMANCYGRISKVDDYRILVIAKSRHFLPLFEGVGPACEQFLGQGGGNQGLIAEVIQEMKKSKRRDLYLDAIRRRLEASVGFVRILFE
jgi:hypothetical protein